VTIDINAEDNASESIDGIAGSLGTMQTAAVAAGGALAAIGVGSLVASANAAADFESAMVEVEKVTGATSSEMENFNEMVMDMATEIPLAQEELAALTADAARFGIEGSENIREFTETTARMATATNLNVDEAGEALAKLGELTNTPVDEMENLGSAINSLSNNAATSSQEIVDAMLRSSGALSQLGADQTEIAGLSTALNEVSDSSQRAGSRLRRLAQEMMEPKKVGDLAEALGMTAEEFKTMREEDPTEVIRMMAETMNEGEEEADILRSTLSTTSRQAVAGLSNNLEGLDEALQNSNDSFEEATSLQEEFEASTDTFNSQVQLLQNRLNNVAITTGQALLPVLNDALSVVNDLIGNFAEFNGSTDGMAGTVAGLTATVGGLTIALGTLAGISLGPLVATIGAVAAAVGALALAWETNFLNIQQHTADLIAVVEGFGADVGKSFGLLEDDTQSLQKTIAKEFALSEKQTEQLESTISDSIDLIEGALDSFGDAIEFLVINYYEPMMGRIEKLTETHLGETVDEFIETFEAVIGYVQWFAKQFDKFWSAYGDEIIAVIKPILKLLEVLFAQTFDAIFTTIRVILNLIQGDWEEAWDAIEGYGDRTMKRIDTAITAFFDGLEALWTLRLTILEDLWDALWSAAETILDAAVSAIETAINGFVNWMENQWDNFVASLEQTWDNAWNAIETALENAFNSMVQFVRNVGQVSVYDAFYAVGQAIRGVFIAVFNAIVGAGGLLRGFFTDIVNYVQNDAKTDAQNAFQSVMDAIETKFDQMVTAVIGAGGIIRTFITDTVNYIRTGAKEDVQLAFQNLLDAAQTKWDNFKSDVIGAGGTVKSMISDIYTYITTGAKEDIREAFDDLVGVAMDAFQGLYDGLIGNSLIKDMINDITKYLGGTGWLKWDNAFKALHDVALSWMNEFEFNGTEAIEDFVEDMIDAIGGAVEEANDLIADIELEDIPTGTGGAVDIAVRSPASPFNNNGGDSSSDDEEDDEPEGYEVNDDGSLTPTDDIPTSTRNRTTGDYGRGPTPDEVQEESNNEPSGSDDSSDDGGSSGSGGGFWSDPIGGIGDTIGGFADDASDFLGFANGGVVTSPVAGVIGEAGQNEAVVPLDRLNTMLDTSYEAGVSGGAQQVDVRISVEGDDELTRLIRENANVVVEENEQSKKDRLQRY